MLITFPAVWALDEAPLKNPVRQLAVPSLTIDGAAPTFTHNTNRGHLFQPADGGSPILLLQRKNQLPDGYDRILHATVDATQAAADISSAEWLRHPALPTQPFDHSAAIKSVLDSWTGAFSYAAEDIATNVKGLRKPQIGAVHAVHSHWSVSSETGTVVMPTGTGKTETMLAVLVSAKCRKVLVVVPTDALRSQLADKFLTLGVLKAADAAILASGALTPIVCTLKHFPTTEEEVDDLFERANVIIATSNIAGQCGPNIQARMAHHCDVLFVDEAHHAGANTWVAFKAAFAGKRILQFTATPFREDGKLLDGEIIYKYPLLKAQEEGYFRPISFQAVTEFNVARVDEAIADRAVSQLRADDQQGFRHVLMARVADTRRAGDVFAIYSQYAEFNPVQIHTGIKSIRERERIREQIISGHARIIVCVDMLGEGFDLPALKIAAFHDIRKTLAVTLQLAGRFTRARQDLGNATFVANTAEVQVRDELRKLYTRDPDWNVLLPQLSDQMIGEQISLQQFLRGFAGTLTRDIPLKTVRPATSAVVYRTRCQNWSPENFRAGIYSIATCEQVHHAINAAASTLVVVTARRVPIEWSNVEQLFSWEWELYVLYWAEDQNQLFINSSGNSGEYKALAQAVCGNDVELVKGQNVFKTFANVNRLRLQNVGLTEQLGRNVRYTGRMGADVEGGMTDAQRQRSVKSVLSGSGFENGERVTVGASRKGRIWSHRRERVDELIAWCRGIGAKLRDPNNDPAQILQGTLEAQIVDDRPAVMPIAADWPEEIYQATESQWMFVIDGTSCSLADVDIELATQTLAGPVRFAIVSDTARAEFELQFFQDGNNPNYRFVLRGQGSAHIRRGGSGARAYPCTDWFYDNPPVIWFANGASLEGNTLFALRHQQPPYDRTKFRVWDWTGTDITAESQGPLKTANTIQARVIRELMGQTFDVIFDDDNPGEAADVVAIRVVGGMANPTGVEVEFHHCKFSGAATAGHRVADLYELCGQAQKSTGWMTSHERRTDLFTHLLRRQSSRMDRGGPTRYERGDEAMLLAIREISHIWPVSLRIVMIQPGVSQADASVEQLTLISVTENYLRETYNLALEVITSA